jgi:hypothetical protein
MTWGIRLAICFAMVASAPGCAKRQAAPSLDVSGTVKLNGQPLDGAIITFFPVRDTPGAGAVGRTDSAGAYKLQARRRGEGVVAGEYKVVLSRWLMPDGTPVPPTVKLADSGGSESLTGPYAHVETTKLRAKISSTETKFDFDVASNR